MDIRPWGYITAYDPPVCERDYSLCVWEDGQPKTLCESRQCQSSSSKTTACKLACEDPYLKKCYASEDECPRLTTSAIPIPIPTSNKNVIQSSSSTSATSTSNVPASNNSNNNIIDLCIFFSMLVLIFMGLVYVMMSS